MNPFHQVMKQGFCFLLGINFANFFHYPTSETLVIALMTLILVGVTNVFIK